MNRKATLAVVCLTALVEGLLAYFLLWGRPVGWVELRLLGWALLPSAVFLVACFIGGNSAVRQLVVAVGAVVVAALFGGTMSLELLLGRRPMAGVFSMFAWCPAMVVAVAVLAFSFNREKPSESVTIQPFSKCPQCWLWGARRTSCSCGYQAK